MEEISSDLFEELLKQPEKKPKKKKKVERTYRVWFYEVPTHNGDCSNPDCIDPRGKSSGVTQVWDHPTGVSMCRFCFLGKDVIAGGGLHGLGWLDDDVE